MSEQAASPCLAGRESHPSVDHRGQPWSVRLCDKHVERLRRMLHEIETEVRDLDAVPSIAVTWNTGGGGNSGSATPAFMRAPARLDALVHTDSRVGDVTRSAYHQYGYSPATDGAARDGTLSAVDVLNYWASRVRAARDIAAPTVTMYLDWKFYSNGPHCARTCNHESCGYWITDEVPALPDLHTDRVLLSRNVDWATEQPWVGTFYAAMKKLLNQLQQVNGTAPEKPLPGKCPAQPTPGVECGGPLWPTKPVYISETEKTEERWTGAAPNAIACGSCKTRWQGGHQIALLWLTLEQQEAESA